MFSNAKKLSSDTPKAKKAKKEIAIGQLEKLAAVDAAIKALTGIKESLEGEVKDDVKAHMINEGFATHSRPENFKGIDGAAYASCEMRIRSSRSALSDDEATLLEGNGIKTGVAVDVADCFVINPKYSGDMKLLGLIEKKLSTIKDLPEDLIMKQEGKSRKIVTEDAINDVFKLFDRDVIESLIPLVSVIALKPTYDGNPFDMIAEIVGATDEAPKP